MSLKFEQVVIDEVLLIAKAVKKHLQESDCKHSLKEIMREALSS